MESRKPFVGSHAKSVLLSLNELRIKGQLCDVTLTVDGSLFVAHRAILAACSDYFCAMFTNQMSESIQSVVELRGLKAATMEVLLEFIYTEQVEVTVENVQELLPAACLLQLKGVEMRCSEFLKEQLDSSNCLGIKRFAETHSTAGLLAAAESYCLTHFSEITKEDEFLDLTPDEFSQLICRDNLEMSDESEVYEAVIRWVKHNKDERNDQLFSVLEHVRLPLLSPVFITDVVDTQPLVKTSHDCRDLVDEAKMFHLRPDRRAEMHGPRFQPRTGGDVRLIVIGGFGVDRQPLSLVEEFNPKTSDWRSLPELEHGRRYLATVAHHQRLYVIGGYNGTSRLSSVTCLDFANQDSSDFSWTQCAPMSDIRGLPGSTVYNELIYVAGGFDGDSRHNSVEAYDPKIDRWSPVTPMNVCREGAGLVATNDVIYSIGGYDGVSIQSSVEVYDPNSGQWMPAPPMNIKRSGAGVTVANEMIYVFGGFDGTQHIASVECFNPRANKWTVLSDMNSPRCYAGGATIHGRIYAVSGYDGQSLIDTVEVYDPWRDKWKIQATKMNERRCDAGVTSLLIP
ncbi:kelch-like protein 12 [Strongylocentrotus purpuratus]|uniref:BTB domain-containing protein n=1 Tax=Strongylocentrotus purpuratus TaxID=7668 RepID=A0A7M7N1J4_STRPU|nr:kelch-like protein 12 [Strongylocentrotus purpuratus]